MRFSGGGPGCGLLAGVWLAAIGAVLISPVGEWIIKGIGQIALALGVLVIVLTITTWLTGGPRRPYE
jgi:ABC-type multidrug transport system permease subunit